MIEDPNPTPIPGTYFASGEACGEVSGEAAVLREQIEDLLDEFSGVTVTRIVADEIVNRLLYRLLAEVKRSRIDREAVSFACEVADIVGLDWVDNGPRVVLAEVERLRAEVARLSSGDTPTPDDVGCARCAQPSPSKWCADCVDRCHEATEFDHSCAICRPAPSPADEPTPDTRLVFPPRPLWTGTAPHPETDMEWVAGPQPIDLTDEPTEETL